MKNKEQFNSKGVYIGSDPLLQEVERGKQKDREMIHIINCIAIMIVIMMIIYFFHIFMNWLFG